MNGNNKKKCKRVEILFLLLIIIVSYKFFGKEIIKIFNSNNREVIRVWLLGLLLSVGLGNSITRILVRYMKAKIDEPKEYMGKFTLPLGILESFSYTFAWVFDHPTFIALWLGLKMAGRWPTTREKPEYKGEINSFLIGNLSTIIFSVLAGVLIKYLLKPIIS